MTDKTTQIAQLHLASLQLATGFERVAMLPQAEQAEALREAIPALIEMRRNCDRLLLELKPRSIPAPSMRHQR